MVVSTAVVESPSATALHAHIAIESTFEVLNMATRSLHYLRKRQTKRIQAWNLGRGNTIAVCMVDLGDDSASSYSDRFGR